MAIMYTCKHCKFVIGHIKSEGVLTSLFRFQRLSVSGNKQMIHYKANGDVLIRVICKNCEQTLMEHPNYHALEYFIH